MHKMRLCQLEDLAALRDLAILTYRDTFSHMTGEADLQAYFETAYSLETLKAELLNPESEYVVIEANGDLIAYTKLNWHSAQTEARGGDRLEVQRIYVHPDHKRQGIGMALLERAYQKALALGKSYIWLGVWEHNEPAKAFYHNQGFVKVGSHEFWTGNQLDIDHIMERDLRA